MKMSKKILSLFLSLLMVISVIPVTVLSASAEIYASGDLQLRWLSSSNFLSDSSGHNRNANSSNSSSWDTSVDYDAVHFSGSVNDLIYNSFDINNLLGDGICGGVEGGAGTTISFMAKAENPSADTPYFCIFNKNYGSSGKKTLFSLAPNGAIVYSNSSGSGFYPSTNAKATGEWQTFVIKFFSSKTVEIWVDGVQKYRETSAYYDNHTFDVPNSIKVGANRENNSFFSGYIRDFRIYNKDLDAVQLHNNILECAEKGVLNTNISGTVSGMVVIGTESRWGSNQFNIVNDQ